MGASGPPQRGQLIIKVTKADPLNLGLASGMSRYFLSLQQRSIRRSASACRDIPVSILVLRSRWFYTFHLAGRSSLFFRPEST